MATGQPVSALERVDMDMLETIADEYASQFTRTEELLAQLVDGLGVAVFLLQRIDAANWENADRNVKRLKQPERVPRPGDEQKKRKKRGTTVAELMAMGGGNG